MLRFNIGFIARQRIKAGLATKRPINIGILERSVPKEELPRPTRRAPFRMLNQLSPEDRTERVRDASRPARKLGVEASAHPLWFCPLDGLGDGSVDSSRDNPENGLDDSRGCHGVKPAAVCADDEDRRSEEHAERGRLPVPAVE